MVARARWALRVVDIDDVGTKKNTFTHNYVSFHLINETSTEKVQKKTLKQQQIGGVQDQLPLVVF